MRAEAHAFRSVFFGLHKKSFGGCRRRLAWAGLDWTMAARTIGRAPSAYPFPAEAA